MDSRSPREGRVTSLVAESVNEALEVAADAPPLDAQEDAPEAKGRARNAKRPPREMIAEVVRQGVTRARIKGLIDLAFATEISVPAECPECGAVGLKARVPDVKKQLDVVAGLLEQAEGRPGQAEAGATSVTVMRPPIAA